uniref:V-SNARE coiled-coil homology domain-containing protein n=1 Tax=Junco hyemalis TaxID=40217 RepID=A0A8C5IVK2_JUNHY
MDTSANTRYRGLPGNGGAGVWAALAPAGTALLSLWWCQPQHQHPHAAVCPQNPRDADPMTRVQAELDETKIILVRLQGWGCCLHGPGAPLGQGGVPQPSPDTSLGRELPLLFPFCLPPFSSWGFSPLAGHRLCPLLLMPVSPPLCPISPGAAGPGVSGRAGGGAVTPPGSAGGSGAQHSFPWQHNTMESLLERGEKLDDLVSKSEVLGAQSKAFYKTARKQNSCCEIM